MTSKPACRCLLCRVEKQLLAELASSPAAYERLLGCSSNGLRTFASPFDLLSHLKATPTASSSDGLFRALLKARNSEPRCVETLMILSFVPVLHGTARRIAKQQVRLARADIAQQALTAFLEILRSEPLRRRQSHFAFAISRAVKRRLFEWAGREGTVERTPEEPPLSPLPDSPHDDTLERLASLRHFLCRCLDKGALNDAELDLLIQIKLDGNTGEEIADSHSTTPNAVRQRMKRLLAKLRRLAANGPRPPRETSRFL